MAVWPSVIAGSTIYTGTLMPTNVFINLAESARVARITQTLAWTLAAAMNCSIWTSKDDTKNIENKSGDHFLINIAFVQAQVSKRHHM